MSGGGYMSWGVYVQGVSVQGLVSFLVYYDQMFADICKN